jgi:hypothetical protein
MLWIKFLFGGPIPAELTNVAFNFMLSRETGIKVKFVINSLV